MTDLFALAWDALEAVVGASVAALLLAAACGLADARRAVREIAGVWS